MGSTGEAGLPIHYLHYNGPLAALGSRTPLSAAHTMKHARLRFLKMPAVIACRQEHGKLTKDAGNVIYNNTQDSSIHD